MADPVGENSSPTSTTDVAVEGKAKLGETPDPAALALVEAPGVAAGMRARYLEHRTSDLLDAAEVIELLADGLVAGRDEYERLMAAFEDVKYAWKTTAAARDVLSAQREELQRLVERAVPAVEAVQVTVLGTSPSWTTWLADAAAALGDGA